MYHLAMSGYQYQILRSKKRGKNFFFFSPRVMKIWIWVSMIYCRFAFSLWFRIKFLKKGQNYMSTLFSSFYYKVPKNIYYTALNAINLQCTFDQGKSLNGRDRARVNIAPVKQCAIGAWHKKFGECDLFAGLLLFFKKKIVVPGILLPL